MRENDIAIIGMSCRFPGANNVDEFWDIIAKGKNLISGIPEERRKQFDFSSLSVPKGAFLEKPFHFDNTHFKIGTEEAQSMDPQQRIMLELAVEAKESANIRDFDDKNIGVFVGANQRAYTENITTALYKKQIIDKVRELESLKNISAEIKTKILNDLDKIEQAQSLNPLVITGNISNMVASRISHEFNLTGPSLTTDTACSSSLVAVHLACECLLNKECNMAFAGGVNLNLAPSIFLMMEAAQVISHSGKCIPFSEESDGILLGEGAGFVLLKRLDDAIKDGNPVLCIIKGSGMNNDGHSLGIMTPSWKGQLSLLQSVYSKSDYDPRNISLIEAHGTSTPIGDSIEITVLQRFFSNQKQQLSIGSVKSNIGHSLGASGIAGLIKTVLAITNKKLPPSVLGERVNPKWDLNETGFKIQDSLEEWGNGHVRAAGVSSFGFGGTNAHVILEEPGRDLVQSDRNTFQKTQFSKQKFTYDIYPGLKQKNEFLYSVHWNEINPVTEQSPNHPDTWLLFCSDEKSNLREKLSETGIHFSVILMGNAYSRLSEDTYTLNPADENHLRWFLEGLDKSGSYGIMFIPGTADEDSADKTIQQLLFLKQIFKHTTRFNLSPTIWCFTSGAFKVFANETISPSQHAISAAFGTAMNENPGIGGGIIDFESDLVSENNCELTSQLIHQNFSYPLIVRNGKFYSPSLLPVIKSEEKNREIRNGGVYLIVGGSSGIGEEIAKYLIQKHNCNIIITGTRPEENLSVQLKSHVSRNLEYVQVSATDNEKVQLLVENIFQKYGQLNGIIFSAGLINYSTFNSMKDADFKQTIEIKISGIYTLHEAIKDRKIDFVYLMSSVSALSPSWATGISAYAAANAYLDGFADRFSSSETSWISAAWSIWQDTGMSKNMNLADVNSMIPLSIPLALELFERSLSTGNANIAVIHQLDVAKFTPRWAERKIKVREIQSVPTVEKVKHPATTHTSDFKSIIIKLVAEATEIPLAEIDEDESFSNLGLDSISALDIVGELENKFELTLNPTLLYEYDSISRLSEYFSKLKNPPKPAGFPLLPTQKAFYSNHVFYPDSPCNSLVKITFNKQLDYPILQQSWNLLSKKHESLRLAFDMTDTGPEQHVVDFSPVQIEHLKIGNNDNPGQLIREIEDRMVHKVYRLNQPPLYDLYYIYINEAASVLILNAHHIITDAWSMSVLLKELVDIYTGISSGLSIPESDTAPLFSTYVNEFRLKKPLENNEGGEYWLNELREYQPFEFPAREKLDCQIGTKTGVCLNILDPDKTSALENKAKQANVSLFQLLISGYFKVLQKITGQNDLVIRLATANRERSFKSIQNLTGCLADSIPLRITMEKQDSLFDISETVKNKLLQSRKFTSISSIEYAGILNSRSQSGPVGITPFGMSYLNIDFFNREKSREYPSIETRAALPFTDLSLICLKQNGNLIISWNYSTACFSDEEIQELSLAYEKILSDENSVRNSENEIPEIDQLEMPGKALFPKQKLLHEKVFAACNLFNKRTAINDQGFIVSYAELKARSIQLANAIIRAENLKKETIGILEYPGATATVGILAILSSGNAYVPMDPDWPAGRIEDIISHSGIEILLTSSVHLKKIHQTQTAINQLKYVILPGENETKELPESGLNLLHFNNESAQKLLPHSKSLSSESLAYIMYTSGTTGVPKGVMVQHRAVEVFLNWISEEFKFDTIDKFIQTSSLGFGGSIRQIFSTLLAGGEIHPINRFDFKDPKSLLQFMSEKGITVLNTVPSVLNNICEFVEQTDFDEEIKRPEKLRLLLIGGEIFPAKLVERWKKHFGNSQRIINLYGSTETLVNATFHEVRNDDDYTKGIPVGRPRKGSHVLLLNENGIHAKPGEKGELVVGGPSIAKGYFKLDNLTKEKFILPAINGAEGIYYRTGDLASKDENGEYHFLGRNDNQIQLYGNRIEPAEIEAVLTSYELVNYAVILDFQDGSRHWLTAFVVLKGSNPNNAEIEIRNFVAGKLPSYMVPQKIEILREMPLTQAGKIDRLSLRNNYKNTALQNQNQVVSTNTQLIIKRIWEKVLKVEISDLNHDFFSLGGDSILALEVLYNLRKEFHNTPKPIELFRKKTIRDLAESIDQINNIQNEETGKSEDELYENNLESLTQFPLSITQKGFFIINKLNPEFSPNLVALIPVKGKIHKPSFQKALNFLVERHPMLRTRFLKKGLNTVQEITAFKPVEIEFADLSQNQDSGPEIRKMFDQYKKLKFDLSEPPLYRLTSYSISENSSVLLFCIHHIIGDAWSMKILTDELLEVYDQFKDGKSPMLPELKTSFLNLINEEARKNRLLPHQIATTQAFWKEIFKGLPTFELHQNWLLNSASDEKVKLTFSGPEKEGIKGYCAENGISLFQMLFTVFARSLQKVLKVNRMLINTSVSGRDLSISGIDKIIGCFARSLPVNVQFTDDNLHNNVIELQRSFIASSENHEIPPNELVRISMESGAESMQSMYRFFISYMDFSSLNSYESSNLEFQWDNADYFFNAGSVESKLFIGIRISDIILINLNGKTNSLFKNEVKKRMQDDLSKLLHPEIQNPSNASNKNLIDSALIAYFPSLTGIIELLPGGNLSHKLAKEFMKKILPGNEPQMLEIETTPFGRTGAIFIPYFADELPALPQGELMESIKKAVNVCRQNGAKYISLAGNLPSKTNYGFAVTNAMMKTENADFRLNITTGHSCTVVAVVKTIAKVLEEFNLEIENLSVGIAGFGSIGQASINLLLTKIGHPSVIKIADLASQIAGLQKSITNLKKSFPNRLEVIPVDKTVPEEFYKVDIIIGASSSGKVLNVSKFMSGTILVDDSFPPIVDVKKAVSRMKSEKDILIIGAGKLAVGKKERVIIQNAVPESWIRKSIERYGDEGLPGCQVESLLMSFDNSLPATIGLVTDKNASEYWEKVNELNLDAVGFHLQGFQIDNSIIEKIKTIHKKKNGPIR